MNPRTRFQAMAFLGSFLAFCLELAAAKLLLPRFGGSAFVWTGAMIFFQALLLLSYLYGRDATSRPRLHAALLGLPFFFLPLSLPKAVASAEPFGGLLWALIRSVGAPFFVLSTTVVVAQTWLLRTKLPERRDGYFLYAASNAGAASALFAYPFLIEPLLGTPAQGWLWRALYATYAILCLSCAPRGAAPAAVVASGRPAAPRERLLWTLLSAAPCAALLSATTLLSLDFAAVPLLWMAPLAAYLLTFVLCFKREPWYPRRDGVTLGVVGLWTTVCLLPLAAACFLAKDDTTAMILTRALDLGKFAYVLLALFALSMVFHKSLADGRPESERAMPSYYACIAAGGLLGSALVGLGLPWLGRDVGAVALDWGVVAALALAAVLTRDWEQVRPHRKTAAALAALALVALGAIASAGSRPGTVFNLRNFYGVYSVRDSDGLRALFHGNTDHGRQSLDPAKQSRPLSYYGVDSPLGEAWAELGAEWNSVGVVGLGAGSVAAYGRPGMAMDFYELDPDVVSMAKRWFTHLRRSPADIRTITGDGRLSLERAVGASYDVLILDAFSSGSVPVHLLTTEAFQVYLSRLRPGGVILLHVSNRYLDLRPVLAATARDLGLAAAAKKQDFVAGGDDGRVPSVWVAVSRDADGLLRLVQRRRWAVLDSSLSNATAWTDQHASLLPALVL